MRWGWGRGCVGAAAIGGASGDPSALPLPTLLVLASCHALVVVDGKLVSHKAQTGEHHKVTKSQTRHSDKSQIHKLERQACTCCRLLAPCGRAS